MSRSKGSPALGKAAKKEREENRTAAREGGNAMEWIKSIAIAIILAAMIRTFLIQAFTIPSGSMENTLRIGDYLMVNNAIFGTEIPFTGVRIPAFRDPEAGDIVVFRPTYNDPIIDVVKRVIGAPGDTVQMVERQVYRNGELLEEPYVEPNYLPDQPLVREGPQGFAWHLGALPSTVDPKSYTPSRDNWGPLVVPEDEYILLGDNRDQSLDSRYMGFIPREVIRGKALFIYYSIDPFQDRPFPRFLTSVRWDRLGQVIR